ncbi:unnamed protein product [Cuscuta epithymum]|uniref:Pseudouridine synthase RsuA/RluA-like domain-containing protein n=2 Tax=Cuscuta epithymum TaxID=186058 RepID=A0AAV0FKY1_9ASTE|nr:unnamed protein product [Cuscuta epithymum]CAH9135932.1 unnamed protein product [Cuscuta epithymum]
MSREAEDAAPVTTAAAPPQRTFGEPWTEFNDGLTYHDLVRPADAGLTLIEFYSRKYKSSAPVQGWLQRIQNKQITVDGIVVSNPDARLRSGAQLVYHRLPWKEPYAPYVLDVLFEDKTLIALNKPSGLQVLPGGLFQQRTVLTQLQRRERNSSNLSTCGESSPVPVHRLGRGTSGILLCAKTKLAKSCLASYFADGTSIVQEKRHSNVEIMRARKIVKIYRALVSGIINEDEVVIEQPIGMIRYPGVAKGLYVASPSGKPALSNVRVLERRVENNCTLIEVEIQSGRPHQIRIHLSSIGHPLIGDPLYTDGGQPRCFDPDLLDETFAEDGGYQRPENPVPGDCGYNLHAHKLTLPHPITQELVTITAPLPSILKAGPEASLYHHCSG